MLFNEETLSWRMGLVAEGNRIDNMWRHGQRLKALLVDHGVPPEDIIARQTGFAGVSIPGYFRPTKEWDFIVCQNFASVHNRRRVVAVVEFKSQLGSVAKNQPNRLEEAVGNITDLRMAQAAGLLGPVDSHVWAGYCMLCCPIEAEIKAATSIKQSVLPVDPTFVGASEMSGAKEGSRRITGVDYIQRYGIGFDRLTSPKQYDRTCFMLTSDELIKTSVRYVEPFRDHGAEEFAASMLEHVLAVYRAD